MSEIENKFVEKMNLLKEETTFELNKAVGLHTDLKRKYD
jgi:hypothetical protein